MPINIKNTETKTIALKRIISRDIISKLTLSAVLIAIGAFAPFVNQQMITGPIVNACLFVGAALLGLGSSVFVGLMPSLIALSIGLLPAALAPMIPFIMVGNAILILVFSWLRKRNYWLAVISASITKFAFLFSASFIVSNLIIKKEIAVKAASMMSWPQLATSLLGGAIAYSIMSLRKKRE